VFAFVSLFSNERVLPMAANYDFQRECLDKARASGGALNGLVPHLFSNNVIPTPSSDLTSLTEAAYDGYAPGSAVVWSAAYINEAVGQAEMKALIGPFGCTGTTLQETEYGCYLETAATGSPLSNSLALSALFNTPAQISRVGDGVMATLIYRYDGTLTAVVDDA
jgi:hypothetical protein